MLFDLIKKQRSSLILKLLKIFLINSLFKNQECFLNFIQLLMKKKPNFPVLELSNKIITKKKALYVTH